jgi:hypothetical protein
MHAEVDVLDVLANHVHGHFTELDLLREHQYSVWAMITTLATADSERI